MEIKYSTSQVNILLLTSHESHVSVLRYESNIPKPPFLILLRRSVSCLNDSLRYLLSQHRLPVSFIRNRLILVHLNHFEWKSIKISGCACLAHQMEIHAKGEEQLAIKIQ